MQMLIGPETVAVVEISKAGPVEESPAGGAPGELGSMGVTVVVPPPDTELNIKFASPAVTETFDPVDVPAFAALRKVMSRIG